MAKTLLKKKESKALHKLPVRASKKPLNCSFKYGCSLKQHNCLKLKKEFDSFEDFFQKSWGFDGGFNKTTNTFIGSR